MKVRVGVISTLMLITSSNPLPASSITAYDNQTVYKTTNHVFSRNDLAQGFVRLNDGFTVMPSSCVNMDVLFTVSGGIDLRETSTIRMLKDLEFDSGVTLTTGGNIDGRGHTLILNGDFKIPAGKVLHFNGDTIIDARGHEIVVGENAEIFVDTNVTLTIANATIKTTRNVATYPALRCGGFNSKLALDNVTLAPTDDFLFLGGQFFIHNDVTVTGTSAFIYNSPVPSFITKNSRLYIDHGITFSMAPATFTDAPYSLKNTYTDNNFIKMADKTSVLYLNGCTLQTTNTGWRLTTGTVNFDDRVQITTDPTLTMTALEPIFRMQAVSVDNIAWHPSGNYIALNIYDISIGGILEAIYSFDGISPTLVAWNMDDTTWPTMNWSPDGRYLVVGGKYSFDIYGFKIFSFDGTSLTLVTSIGGSVGGSPSWSPDGRYLTLIAGTTMQIYRFDGSSVVLAAQITGNAADELAWSKDGRHIIAVASGSLRVYDFDGAALTLRASIGLDGTAWTLSVCPDGRYIGVPIYETGQVAVYRFDGDSLVLIDRTPIPIPSIQGFACDWSHDGRYFIVGYSQLYGGSATPYTNVYSFDGTSLTLIPGSVMRFPNAFILQAVKFSPNGKYLAAGCASSAITDNLFLYSIDYVQTATPSTLATSMVLGNSTKGSAYDVHLRLKPEASVNLTGKMLYDNVDGEYQGQ